MADGREMALPERERNSVDKHGVPSWTEGHERYPHLLIPDGRYTEALNQNQPVGFSVYSFPFRTPKQISAFGV